MAQGRGWPKAGYFRLHQTMENAHPGTFLPGICFLRDLFQNSVWYILKNLLLSKYVQNIQTVVNTKVWLQAVTPLENTIFIVIGINKHAKHTFNILLITQLIDVYNSQCCSTYSYFIKVCIMFLGYIPCFSLSFSIYCSIHE